MRAEKFEDLLCWQKGKLLAVLVYKYFGSNRDFSFKDQIQRATISISNNIAEGFERKSNKEFNQFLHIAKGSAGELRSMLHIALELEYVDRIRFEELYTLSVEISKMLSGLIKTL